MTDIDDDSDGGNDNNEVSGDKDYNGVGGN